MKTNRWLMLVGISVTLASCYDDKGNYEYAGLDKIESKVSHDALSISIGQTLHIEPEISCTGGEAMESRLIYSWDLEGDIISTEPVLDWVVDRYPKTDSGNLILTVTDPETEIVYRCAYSLSVLEKYEGTGVFILSKNRTTGVVGVHLLKEETEVQESEDGESSKQITYYEPYLNIFSDANFGEVLPSSTFKLHEHYANEVKSSGSKSLQNQFTFASPNQLVSVSPGTFEKDNSTLEGMFSEGMPVALQRSGVEDIFFGHYLDLITDKEGHVYTRIKTSDEFFDFDKFLSEPLAYLNPETGEKEVLTGIKLLPSGFQTQLCVLHDTDKNRLFVIWDSHYRDFGDENEETAEKYVVGKLELITSDIASDWPSASGVPTIEEAFSDKYEMVHIAPYVPEHSTSMNNVIQGSFGYGSFYFCILKDRESGNLYQYEFALVKDYSLPTLALVSTKYAQITGQLASLLTDPNSKICTLKSMSISYGVYKRFTFIANGNSLYVYNRDAALSNGGSASDGDNKEELQFRLLETFDSPIAAMVSRDASVWPQKMGLMFEDGSAEVLSLENAQYSTWDGHVWKSEGLDLGEPIDMLFESPHSINW